MISLSSQQLGSGNVLTFGQTNPKSCGRIFTKFWEQAENGSDPEELIKFRKIKVRISAPATRQQEHCAWRRCALYRAVPLYLLVADN